MVKLPVAGRVKTRLARQVGVAEATRFYRATLEAVVARLGRQPFWETWLSVSPDCALVSRMLPAGTFRLAQGGGDLGRRMQRPMLGLPAGPVCVIGTDIPGIRPGDVRRAFRALGHAGAVLGPAEDGGFWLIGQRRRPRLVWPYDGVGWSRADTRAAVEANLRRLGLGPAATTLLGDVDATADLERWRGTIGRRVLPCEADVLSRQSSPFVRPNPRASCSAPEGMVR